MYLTAPSLYSHSFCLGNLAVFIVSSFVMLRKNCKYTFMKFEFFFLFSFFFTNIIYAIVYYPVNPYFFLFNLPFNENYINKGFALSVMGITFFNIGVYEKEPVDCNKFLFPRTSYYEPRKLFSLLMIFYIPSLVVALLANAYIVDFTRSNINALLIFIVFYLLFALFSNNSNTWKVADFLKLSKSFGIFVLLLFYIIAYMVIGSRTIPIRLGLLVLFLYSVFIANIPKKWVLLSLISGSVLMMTVSVFRARGEFDTSIITQIWDVGIDLTINNRSLYVLMEEADLHGINFGKTMLSSIAAIVPFGQSLLLELTGWTMKDINSANLVTDLYFSTQDSSIEQYGLGTNIIGDVYIAFGTIGVILYMFLLGKLLSFLYRGFSQGNTLKIFCYAMIFIEVIYLARASSLEFCRNITWGFLWLYIFNKIINNRRI